MNRPKRFVRDEGGVSAVEFALLLPILLSVLMGAVTMFDMFRNVQNVEKATFTVGDIISRQTAVSSTNLAAMVSLIKHMVPTASDGALRVSSITMVGGEMKVAWSEVRGTASVVGPDRPLPLDVLPDIADGDSVVLTESFVPHRPFVAGFGLEAVVMTGLSVHRPRFVGAIAFQ